jgi:predicted RNA binding protein YcfA (HicA-like mRNA interferase family)
LDSKDLIRLLEKDGWVWHSTTGSHRHFKHPTKPGKITIPHPKKDMHPKTVKAILKAANL